MKFWQALKALDDGELVEYKPNSLNWEDAIPFTNIVRLSTTFEMNRFDFRLKPKLIEVFVNQYAYVGDQKFGPVYLSEERCKNSRDAEGYVRTIKLREVVE